MPQESFPVVLGLDLGTTAVKCLAVDRSGDSLSLGRAPHPISAPRPGWLEQNPEDWWRASCQAIRACLAGLPREAKPAALAVTGHMSALTLFDQEMRPLHPSILIGDTRATKQAEQLREIWGDVFREATGNYPISAFTVAKLRWVAENEPAWLANACLLLFPKDYLRYRLTGAVATDATDAANSLLLLSDHSGWDVGLIEQLGLPPGIFPPLRPSSALAGSIRRQASGETGLPDGLPVLIGAADMAATLLGSGVANRGTIALTLSTSCQILAVPPRDASGLKGIATFHPRACGGGSFVLGSIFAGGLALDWVLRLFGAKLDPARSALLLEAARAAPGSDGAVFLPFLSGSGTPTFSAADRGAWIGLTATAGPALLLRAALEGISFDIRRGMEAMAPHLDPIDRIILGGGGSLHPLWPAIVASVLRRPLEVLRIRDAAALGACCLAGEGAGWESADRLAATWVKAGCVLQPDSSSHQALDAAYRRFLHAREALAPEREGAVISPFFDHGKARSQPEDS